MAQSLPQITLQDKTWFIDECLAELRETDNPHSCLPFRELGPDTMQRIERTLQAASGINGATCLAEWLASNLTAIADTVGSVEPSFQDRAQIRLSFQGIKYLVRVTRDA